ncbi:minor capsid protein [Gordonia caeni]|uniref:DUF3168 domain-containing protein n=1 Tax=Gordonia caeni TaxID=1007097 RepID=A0ABP7PBU1_9ACTN
MRAPAVNDLLDSCARHLDERGVATYSLSGVYSAPTAPAVFFGQLYDQPDRAVAINHYLTVPDPITHLGNPSMRFQLRWRGDKNPTTVHQLADAAFGVLHTLTPGSWPGGLRFLWVQRLIVAPIEPDASGRWERCDSYEIQLNPIGA